MKREVNTQDPGRGGMCVLVVEDDPEQAEILREQLQSAQYRVEVAATGNEALSLAQGLVPDLVLLDVILPDLDGYQVCARLRRHSETEMVPVVMLTGLGATEDRIRALEVGADDFLTKPYNLDELLARVKSLMRIRRATRAMERVDSVITSLALIVEARDPYSEGHSERVARTAEYLGRRLTLEGEELRAMSQGAMLHDLGNVAVPDRVLLKQGPLTESEMREIRRHPVVGYIVCAPLHSARPFLPVIRHHHEHWDGSGYPDGLVRTEIPLPARIVALADAYDSLTSVRPFRKAMAPSEAVEFVHENRGVLFDPELADEMLAMMQEASWREFLRSLRVVRGAQD